MFRSLVVSFISGVVWGGMAASPMILNDTAGINAGISLAAAAPAGGIAGMLIGVLSQPLYRRLSSRHLMWWTPISLYAAIAVFAALVRGLFQPAPGPDFLRITFQSWWALTFFPLLWPLFIAAFVNHLVVRASCLGGFSRPAVP